MNAGKGPCADFGPAVIGSHRHSWQRVHLETSPVAVLGYSIPSLLVGRLEVLKLLGY